MEVRIKSLSKAIIVLFTISLIPVLLLIITSFGTADQADYAVVLGNKIELDGTPSKRLQARLLKAIDLYKRSIVPTVIVSGGVGKEGFDEAQIMAQFLMKNGIPKSDILIDSEGVNTHATSQNTKELIGIESSVIAVSQQFHISRCKMSLRNAGFTEVSGAFPLYFELRDIYSYCREIPGWLKYKIKGL